MRVHRLVYVLIGAALAVGLLVSAFVRPESRLSASEDCYGLCPSVTALSLSRSTLTYGNERVEKFHVGVNASAPGSGVPTGYVVVESGAKILCIIRLHGGNGSCSLEAKALTRGPYMIVAHYCGGLNFKPSTSSIETLAVLGHPSLRNPSVTALSLSRSTLTYGNERVEKFHVGVNVGAPGSGVPTGYVVVESGAKILCIIRLHGGNGSCSLAAKALTRGPYMIVAHYCGGLKFKPSTSGRRTFLVLRH